MTLTRRAFGRLALSSAAASLVGRSLHARSARTLTTVDTHAHSFRHGLKLAPVRRYTPSYEATLPDYLRQLDEHGISHGVLIQPSFLGTDNAFIESALQCFPDRLRGVAVVQPDTPTAELRRLTTAGFVGLRLNLAGEPLPQFESPVWTDLFAGAADLGWQVEVYRDARDLPQIVDPLLNAGVNVVVDHFGRPDAELGVGDPGFRYLLSVGRTRRVWVKLSGWYRSGGLARGQEIALAAVPLLRTHFGLDRLVWGSDWPHTNFEKLVNYGMAVAAFRTWVPDPADQRVILRDTPRALFKFL